MNFALHVLAQTGTGPQQPSPGANPMFLLAILAAFMVFMYMTSRSQKKKEKRQREDMYASMKKNDRVLTIGGIVGTVMSVKDNEVVLKVDESTNTKMTFLKTAVQRILTEDQGTESEKRI